MAAAQDKALPLSGVRVLDLSRMLAAPFCTQMLGDLGAEVIKIERPGVGDDMRGYGPPYLKARDGSRDDTPYFLCANRNKKSVTVDLSRPEGARLILELVACSDVLVENYKVGDLKRYGLDYETVRRVNPGIVYCSVTGFGQTGPDAARPGLDTVFQALSGLMDLTGEADGPPQKVGVPISDFIGGMFATIGIQAALRHREVNGGAGQHIDISLLECSIAALGNRAQAYLSTGEVPGRRGASTPANEPAGLYPCSDGDLVLSAGSETQFRTLAKVLGREGWITDPRYATRPQRNVNRLSLTAELQQALRQRTRGEWFQLLTRAGLMCAPINTVADAFDEPQVRARGVVVETEHPRAGTVRLIGNPIRLSDTPVGKPVVSPDLGQHTDEVLSALLGKSSEAIAGLRGSGAI